MPWRRGLPADLAHFKSTTMGYPIIMGRRTFESFPKGALPGRRNIVITRDTDYKRPGIEVAGSLEEAFGLVAHEEQSFVIGGAQIYRQSMERVDRLYITVVEQTFPEADTFFPEIDPTRWICTNKEAHPADEKNLYPYLFTTWERR